MFLVKAAASRYDKDTNEPFKQPVKKMRRFSETGSRCKR